MSVGNLAWGRDDVCEFEQDVNNPRSPRQPGKAVGIARLFCTLFLAIVTESSLLKSIDILDFISGFKLENNFCVLPVFILFFFPAVKSFRSILVKIIFFFFF